MAEFLGSLGGVDLFGGPAATPDEPEERLAELSLVATDVGAPDAGDMTGVSTGLTRSGGRGWLIHGVDFSWQGFSAGGQGWEYLCYLSTKDQATSLATEHRTMLCRAHWRHQWIAATSESQLLVDCERVWRPPRPVLWVNPRLVLHSLPTGTLNFNTVAARVYYSNVYINPQNFDTYLRPD